MVAKADDVEVENMMEDVQDTPSFANAQVLSPEIPLPQDLPPRSNAIVRAGSPSRIGHREGSASPSTLSELSEQEEEPAHAPEPEPEPEPHVSPAPAPAPAPIRTAKKPVFESTVWITTAPTPQLELKDLPNYDERRTSRVPLPSPAKAYVLLPPPKGKRTGPAIRESPRPLKRLKRRTDEVVKAAKKPRAIVSISPRAYCDFPHYYAI